jgi:DUF1680 family protein
MLAAAEPDRRVDAVRGCVDFERGPLVYCIANVDIPAETQLEDLAMDGSRQLAEMPRPDIAAPATGTGVPVIDRSAADPGSGSLMAGAIPYFAWANRKVKAMRVWIPR